MFFVDFLLGMLCKNQKWIARGTFLRHCSCTSEYHLGTIIFDDISCYSSSLDFSFITLNIYLETLIYLTKGHVWLLTYAKCTLRVVYRLGFVDLCITSFMTANKTCLSPLFAVQCWTNVGNNYDLSVHSTLCLCVCVSHCDKLNIA